MTQGPGDRRPLFGRRHFVQSSTLAAVGVSLGCGKDGAVPAMDAGDGAPVGDDAGLSADAGVLLLPDGGEIDAPADAGPSYPAPEALPLSPHFDLGVASGDMEPERGIIWTHRADAAPLVALVWPEAADGSLGSPVFATPVETPPSGFVHVEARGLISGAFHRYGFYEVDDDGQATARSELGRFRSAPAATATPERLRLGATSCTDHERDMAVLERAGSRFDLDLFLMLGDTSYNDGATNVTQYRDAWARTLDHEGYRLLRASSSLLCTWDDHEVDNNWDPETISASQLQAARTAFFENQPIEELAEAPERIYRNKRWGQTLEVFVLDCRGERRPSSRLTPTAQYISPEQMSWLKDGLRDSPCVFKVIMNSVPISDFPLPFDAAADDRWEGYAAQRLEILQHIDDLAIGGVLWISGDFHLASMGRVSRDGAGAEQLEVLAGPGAQVANPLHVALTGDQFDWASGVNNYMVFELDPANGEVRILVHDGDDRVVHTAVYDLRREARL